MNTDAPGTSLSMRRRPPAGGASAGVVGAAALDLGVARADGDAAFSPAGAVFGAAPLGRTAAGAGVALFDGAGFWLHPATLAQRRIAQLKLRPAEMVMSHKFYANVQSPMGGYNPPP